MKKWRYNKTDIPKLLRKQLRKSGFANTFDERYSCFTCLYKRVLPANTYCKRFYLIQSIETPKEKVCNFWENVDKTQGEKENESN